MAGSSTVHFAHAYAPTSSHSLQSNSERKYSSSTSGKIISLGPLCEGSSGSRVSKMISSRPGGQSLSQALST